jgi:hypothetical protein
MRHVHGFILLSWFFQFRSNRSVGLLFGAGVCFPPKHLALVSRITLVFSTNNRTPFLPHDGRLVWKFFGRVHAFPEALPIFNSCNLVVDCHHGSPVRT